MISSSSDRINIFISYSHKDAPHLERLKVHLAALDGDIEYSIWDDTRIQAGQRWKTQIDSALEEANAAILLVSADFIASDFIKENELPPLLEAANSKGTCIVPIVLRPCGFEEKKNLSRFQAANVPPSNTLSSKSNEHDQEKWWTDVVRNIGKAIQERQAISPKPLLHPEPDSSSTRPPSIITQVNQNILDFVEQKATLFAGLFLSVLGIPLLAISFSFEYTLLTIISAVVIGIGILWFTITFIFGRQKP